MESMSLKITQPSISTIGVVVGTFALGCGCNISIFSSLAVLGLSTIQIISIDTFFANYGIYLIVIFIIMNIGLIIYNLNKMAPHKIKRIKEKI